MTPRSASGELRLVDWFCGAGGSTQGAAQVPGGSVHTYTMGVRS